MTMERNDTTDASRHWYDLFSRGARDWLRHNEKVREAVREQLPELVANMDIAGTTDRHTVKVPVRFLEHYRFQLRPPRQEEGVGQGDVSPGDVFQTPPQGQGDGAGEGEKGEGAGEGDGGVRMLIELKVSDIVDWLWEELELPNLEQKQGGLREDDYTREGWDRRGARSRLDRRRTMREAIKRRAAFDGSPPFINEDLRFRQLVTRRQPAAEAAVFFVLDASSSMGERDRKLAKSFFFWALQGLRRQYQSVATAFIAHTVKAWEFSEEDFFQVTAAGGTVSSTAFALTEEIVAERFDPARFNLYLFYASDGENFPEDAGPAYERLASLGQVFNFMGYLEVLPGRRLYRTTVLSEVFDELESDELPVAQYRINEQDDVWEAIRAFFRREVGEAA